jgi:hypothetical protein
MINDRWGFEEFVDRRAIKEIIRDPVHRLAYKGALIGAPLFIEKVVELGEEAFRLRERVHLEVHPASAIRAFPNFPFSR